MDTVDKKHRDSKSVILTSSYQCCPSRARTQKTEPLSDDQSGQPKCAWRFGFYAWRCFPDLLMVDRLGHVSFSIQRDVNEYKYIIHNEQVTCSNTNAKKAHKASGEQRWSHRTQQRQKNKQTAWAVRYEACGTKTTVIYILLLLDCALNTQLNKKNQKLIRNMKYMNRNKLNLSEFFKIWESRSPPAAQ